MSIRTVQSPMTIADYCAAFERKEIVTNTEYQRSDRVWPPAARSFLIESMLQGYPTPKFFLFQITDLKSKKTIKEIVDGQQRSKAIVDFFNNQLVIARDAELEDARGKRYDQLDGDLQQAFLNYQLSIDLFLGVTHAQIRETFRRLNSYTVPLNPEEKRNAQYQGALKWAVYRLSRDYEEAFLAMGVLSEKQIVRMQDSKLFAEIIDALEHGIRTTSSAILDSLYKAHDREFDSAGITAKIEGAISLALSMEEIHKTDLVKPHVFYALMLALIHTREPLAALQAVVDLPAQVPFERPIVLANLTRLASALEAAEPDPQVAEFVQACSAKTNVATTRQTRFRWLCRALSPALI